MTPRSATVYRCTECGAEHAKWAGKCDGCGEWNTLVEEIAQRAETGRKANRRGTHAGPVVDTKRLRDVVGSESPRWKTGLAEFDFALGGGIVPGSMVLVGGEPGIGKSRLAAEFATLGAYELSEPAAEAHGDTPHARDGVPTRRVFLFSRVPEPRCARSAETTKVCPATSASRIPRHVRPSERRRVARRRGGIEAAQQPCTVSVVETAKSRPAR